MSRKTKIIASVLAVFAMLMALAACGGQTAEEPSTAETASVAGGLMAGIYDKLLVNEDYAQWKSSFSATTITEKLDGDSILISAHGEEGVDGDFTFTLDGDYIVTESPEGDYTGYAIMTLIRGAVADYYGMNDYLMNGWLAGLMFSGQEDNEYFLTEQAEGKTVFKLYAASEWDMQGLDDMYIDDAALDGHEALTEDDLSQYINCGKITSAILGNVNDLDIFIGEYGSENTELTYKSLMAIVAKLQPAGYENFAAEYTELKEAEGDGWSVSFGLPWDAAGESAVMPADADNSTTNVMEEHSYEPAEGYSYVTVTFGAGDEAAAEVSAPAAEEDEVSRQLSDYAGEYSAERCTITIEPDGENTAKISVHWGQSASESYEYTMTGFFDPDTLRLGYSDEEKKFIAYNDDGSVNEEKVEFTAGSGRIQLHGDGTLSWQDEQEADRLVGMTFALSE